VYLSWLICKIICNNSSDVYGDALNDKINEEWLFIQLLLSEIKRSNSPPPPAAMMKRTRKARSAESGTHQQEAQKEMDTGFSQA